MKKLKEIEKLFGSQGCYRNDNDQILLIRACFVGDNFYDYGETPKEIKWDRISPSLAQELKNDHRIKILKCEDCCGCSGW